MKITLTAADLEKRPELFDWALKTFRAPGDEIALDDGALAPTKGSWAFPEFGYIQLADRVTLTLKPSARVILSKDAVRETDGHPRLAKDLNLLWVGANCIISGGTFDANYQAHPGWNCGGIRFHGPFSGRNFDVVGLSGTQNVQETFVLSGNGATGGTEIEYVRAHSCDTERADSYVSGIYMGATEDNGKPNTVRACSVDLGPNGWFAYSSTYATTFDGCTGSAARFWYTDTGPGIATLVKCVGTSSYSSIGCVAVNDQIREVTAIDCAFLSPEGRTVEWWDKEGRNIGFVVFDRCRLESKFGVASAALGGSLVFRGGTFKRETDFVGPKSPKPIVLP